MNNHLCYSCTNAVATEAEGKDVIYVSFRCKFKEGSNEHCIIIRSPETEHVLECPKYNKVSFIERIKRKYLL